MNKLVFSVLAVVSLLALPSLSQAQTPAPAPTPIDYYKLGQFFGHIRWATNLAGYTKRSDLKAKLDVERRLMVQLGAPAAVLNSYDHTVNSMVELPISTPYSTWTQAEQTAYIASAPDYNTVNAWLGPGDKAPLLYFWVGYDTEWMAKSGPLDLNSWGDTLAAVQSNYKTPLADFVTYNTNYPVSLKTLLPEIQSAIAAIAAYNGKTLAATDIAAIQAQGLIIYNDANGKITP